MIGIRIHGRGGQGAATFAHILAFAATLEGKYGQSSQGIVVERRGAPVWGFARIRDKPIVERGSHISRPDFVVVLDPMILRAVDVEEGLAEDGLVIANSPRAPKLSHRCVHLDATSIALEILKSPVPNTVMAGAFAAATRLVSLESIKRAVRAILGKRMLEGELEANCTALRMAYEEVRGDA
ncbi:MAG: 2-oxoacid:acceptor oxidoreductase family protein [Thermodesulfobacteriota bacterium]